jgi:hypothetical protein
MIEGGALKILSQWRAHHDEDECNSSGEYSLNDDSPSSPSHTVPMTPSSKPSTSSTSKEYLNEVKFWGMTLLGWAIRLKSSSAVDYLIRCGADLSKPVDEEGNTCLHYAVKFGTRGMVRVIIRKNIVLLEAKNKRKYTAGMEGAASGNFDALHEFILLGGRARISLQGKYWAVVLDWARRQERFEKIIQGGIFGYDDETYFTTYPDPHYSYWYM